MCVKASVNQVSLHADLIQSSSVALMAKSPAQISERIKKKREQKDVAKGLEMREPASSFEPGSFSAQDFTDTFGLKSVGEDKAYSEGSTTGTKQVGGLNTYLTEKDFEKNRNSDKTWEAYSSVYGEDAMKQKREGNEDGLSINAFDALMDKLASGEGGDTSSAPEIDKRGQPMKYSPTMAKGLAMSDAYDDLVLSGGASAMATGNNPVTGQKVDDDYRPAQAFKDDYSLNLQALMYPTSDAAKKLNKPQKTTEGGYHKSWEYRDKDNELMELPSLG